MNKVQLTVEVPKELNDVRLALGVLIGDILAKKSVTQIVSDSLSPLITVVGEYQALGPEFSSNERGAVLGLLLSDIDKALHPES